MKKLLITGAGGFLGSHLVNQAKSKFEVFGWSNLSTLDLDIKHSFYFDLSDAHEVSSKLDSIKPDCIIHCAAISSEGGCRNRPVKAVAVNLIATKIISQWSLTNRVRLIFTSTDLVFDGHDAPYNETANIQPKMEYGQLKKQAEIALQSNKFASICRLPLLFGIGLGERKGLLHQFINQVKKGEQLSLFTDEFRTPADVTSIANFLLMLLNIEHSGIIHLGGNQTISRYQLGQQFCKYLHLPVDQLKPIKRADINMEYRPLNTSLESSLALILGYNPTSLTDALEKVRLDYLIEKESNEANK